MGGFKIPQNLEDENLAPGVVEDVDDTNVNIEQDSYF